LLQINNISVYYGNIQAIRNVSIEVNQGEIVTLIGSNGAGKSTILKAISAIVKTSEGKITLNGNEIQGLKPEQIVRRGITHVPEGRRIFRSLTVLQNLTVVGAALRLPKTQIRKTLEEIFVLFPRIEERQDQLGWSLSGGEQQMLTIGRGLMAQPKLMMLDEPSLGLAPNLVQQVFKIIKEINQKGTTILLVEQNASAALSIANRAFVLEVGEVTMHGNAHEMLKNDQIRQKYLGL
jgi:branched-chain amino acid transport system ATP-binding protein